MPDVPICPICKVNPCIVRSNGYLLPRCTKCWAVHQPAGTVTVNGRGYSKTRGEDGHWRFTQHVVAERVLGRPLRDNETVKWVDGDRANCEPENLILVTCRSRPLLAAKRRRSEKRSPRVQINMHEEMAKALAHSAALSECTSACEAWIYIHRGLVADGLLPKPPTLYAGDEA